MVGGLGFIGRRVVESMLERGETVRVVDKVGSSGWSPKGVELVMGDATDFSTIRDAMVGVEGVVNLASYVDVGESVSQPHKYLSNNIAIHLNILEAARRSSVGKVVLASSAAVYGDREPPLREDSETRAVNAYGLSKICSEQLSVAYHRNYGLDTVTLRYFNVIGEGCKNVLKIFVENVMSGKPITLRGKMVGGEFRPASRDFIYVGDVAEATVKALSSPPGHHTINIGRGKAVSVAELAELVFKEVGSRTETLLESLPPHEVLTSWADVSLAERILGWRPTTSLETAVKKYVKWYGGKK